MISTAVLQTPSFARAQRSLACLALAAMLLTTAAASAASIRRKAELGPVKAQIELEPAEPRIGDPVNLRLTVQAEDGVEVLMPEFGEALEAYTILDFVPRQTVDSKGRTTFVQTYRLQPERSGEQAIPPILIEFVDRRPGQKPAPDDQDAYELLTERIDFTVKSVLPKDAEAKLKPPLGKLPPLESPPPSRWPWLLAAVLLGIVMIAVAIRGFSLWRKRRRRRTAYQLARARLERLLAAGLPEGEHVDTFYVELSGIVRRYLEDRFDLRAPELTTEEFLDLAGQSNELTAEHKQLLRDFLKQADLVKFAGHRPSREVIQSSLDAAQRFLEDTRENAPLLDPEREEATAPVAGGNVEGES